MSLQPHQERVVAERDQLAARAASLRGFIAGEKFRDVDRAERQRLLRQESIMTDFIQVLTERIEAFQPPALPAANSGGADLGLAANDGNFALGKACDLSGEGTCEACQ